MKLLSCILAGFVLLLAGCNSVPPAEPAEEAAQEAAGTETEAAQQDAAKEPAEEKPEVERVKFMKLLAETAAKGDRDALRKMFVPMEVIVEIAGMQGKPLSEDEIKKAAKDFEEMLNSKIDGSMLCFKQNDPKSLEFRDIGTSEFMPEEKKEIAEMRKKASHMDGFGEVQIYSGETRLMGARVFRYKGTWYCSDMF
jgi:hypothetical protein